LHATPAALDTATFLLHEPPLPGAAKVPYSLLAAGAVALLPEWARAELELGGGANTRVGPWGGALATKAIRWGLSASLPDYPTL